MKRFILKYKILLGFILLLVIAASVAVIFFAQNTDLFTSGTITNPTRYTLQEKNITPAMVLFSGVSAGDYDPNKLSEWHPYASYAFSSVIEAEKTGLKNVYATDIKRLPDGSWRIWYGGWNSDNPIDTTDRIFTATSNNFISHSSNDLAAPNWGSRAVAINDNQGVANDPSIASYGNNKYVMYFSQAAPSANGAIQHIGYTLGTDSKLARWTVNTPNKLLNGHLNIITVTGQDGSTIDCMQRPSTVFDKGLFYLYYDQGGCTNISKNSGFNIRVATGTAPDKLTDRGEVLQETSVPAGSAAEVESFKNGWILFFDKANINVNSISYATSRDGLSFANQSTIYSDPNYAITNPTVIRDGDRLLGILSGAFPLLSSDESKETICQYPALDWCFSQGKVKAYFLQKKVVFYADDGRTFNQVRAFDADKLELQTNITGPTPGRLEIYDTDSTTLLLSKRITLQPNKEYALAKN